MVHSILYLNSKNERTTRDQTLVFVQRAGRQPAGLVADPRRSPWGWQRAEPMVCATFSNNSDVVAFSGGR